jgi:hypothetical protein
MPLCGAHASIRQLLSMAREAASAGVEISCTDGGRMGREKWLNFVYLGAASKKNIYSFTAYN